MTGRKQYTPDAYGSRDRDRERNSHSLAKRDLVRVCAVADVKGVRRNTAARMRGVARSHVLDVRSDTGCLCGHGASRARTVAIVQLHRKPLGGEDPRGSDEQHGHEPAPGGETEQTHPPEHRQLPHMAPAGPAARMFSPMLHDISIPVSRTTPPWPGDTPYSCTWTWSIARGDSVNVGTITTSPHVGTHADAPLHVRDGAPASESLPIAAFLGDALVVDVSDVTGTIPRDVIAERATRHANPDGSLPPRILLRTGRSIAAGHFPNSWPALDATAASSLTAAGIVLVGTDAPSVDPRESTTLDVHHALFDAGACILENLDLRHVAPGRYTLAAFPQLLVGADAAPLRAILISHD